MATPVVDVVVVEPGRDSRWPLLAVSVAGSLSLLAVLCGWRGGDLAAQVFRVDLFRDHGFVVWNNLWFGGHAAGYYAPLLAFLRSQPGGPSRIEIPVTDHHWESAYVGDSQSLARGWERQLDMSFNPIFYDGTLNATSYQQWLSNLGVRYVALASAPLDSSAVAEAQLLDGGLPYLSPVWQSNDWRVWRYDASPGLISGPATLVQIAPASFTVDLSSPGDVVVRVRASTHWAVPDPGCVTADPNGWTMLRNLPVGSTQVTQALGGDQCR